jgi:hypothetical protein
MSAPSVSTGQPITAILNLHQDEGCAPSPTCLDRQGGDPQGDVANGNKWSRRPPWCATNGGIFMGKVIHRGWSKPGDDIPQPTSIITGTNLRKTTPAPSVGRPFGWDRADIAKWIAEHEAKLNDGDGQ